MRRIAINLNKDNSYRVYKDFIQNDQKLKSLYNPDLSIKDQ